MDINKNISPQILYKLRLIKSLIHSTNVLNAFRELNIILGSVLLSPIQP